MEWAATGVAAYNTTTQNKGNRMRPLQTDFTDTVASIVFCCSFSTLHVLSNTAANPLATHGLRAKACLVPLPIVELMIN